MDIDTESCSSRAVDFAPTHSRSRRLKVIAYDQVLHLLKDSNFAEANLPGFEDELWMHFHRLPPRYALDVNVEKAQDVLMHKRLLHMARDPATRHAIEVRVVQAHFATTGNCSYSFYSNSQRKVDTQCADNSRENGARLEITISTNDKPKLFSQLTSLLSEIGLNIQEAHAFSTVDGYSLDYFLVDGWALEETEQLRNTLVKKIPRIEKHPLLKFHCVPAAEEQEQTGIKFIPNYVNMSTDGINGWEIDTRQLKYEKKIASVSFCDLYKGTFCNQDVAIKVLRAEHKDINIMREFTQEVHIMRNIRHNNVIQFIGACLRTPNPCLVMAIGASEGMKFLHQNNIIHRDLKAANLLMDGNGVVKVSDFGVARMQAQSGVMTAETGTYRWMAPELIEHKPYDHKVDVFSFGVLLWELLTGKLPYEHLTPVQAALGVVQKGLRPTIPSQTNPKLVELLERCWQQDPFLRPEFSEIVEILQQMAKRVSKDESALAEGEII
ncbi:serine/threonine-protein kinase STY17-like isoform X2 [Juglans microcarpa x Juglans regia]|uniref:serine/threonine-protein kinase STY17-like isoform X2 n=1 Tax=Juglans microcarpa x Juglans regia TaxID=2249226 RepID=UPI001B7DF9A9|nr:serine/threonine-protein kinase STY17-like isoform X2 [Juglans microcarpa x Juglans regia]